MIPALIPANDEERLKALRRYDILDTAPSAAFDRITELVACMLDVPTALVSFVDADRQWLKSHFGGQLREGPRNLAFCGYTILRSDCFVVEDARADYRFRYHPYVFGAPGIRFYAGVPLLSSEGLPLGTVAAIDIKPRKLSAREAQLLRTLAGIAADQLELHLATRLLDRELQEHERIRQSKDDLVATVSHELRTPLTAISGSLALVSRGAAGELPEQAARLLDVAYRNSQRLVAIVNDILDVEMLVSTKVAFKREPIAMTQLVAQAIENARPFADQFGLELALKDAPERNDMATGDAGRLLQVMDNLLSNAMKFSPPGGTVEVSVQTPSDTVIVSVRDYGPGVPAAFQSMIFERFAMAEPADRRVSSSGLGLNIARSIVEGQGGRIGFVSPLPDGGTRFWFSLPCA